MPSTREEVSRRDAESQRSQQDKSINLSVLCASVARNYQMKLLDLTLETPAENLALDEALLEEAEQSTKPTEVLRLWESPRNDRRGRQFDERGG